MDDILEIVGTRIPKLQNVKLKRDGKLTLVLSLSDNDGKIISLNDTATMILSLCDGYNNINTIAQTISKQFNTEFKEVRNDTLKLIRSLEGANIISTNL